MNSYKLTICGLDISFNTSASADRVDIASKFIQEKFDALQSFGIQMSKERIFLILALGIADDLLQIQKKQEEILDVVDKKNQQDKTNQAQLESMLQMLNMLKDETGVNIVSS